MNLLSVNSFPRFTRAYLGLPSDADLAEVIDSYLERGADEIRDAIGAAAVTALSSTDPSNQDRRRRFRSAYRDLVESMLWDARAVAAAQRVGTQRQGARQSTLDASVVTSAENAARAARERYAATMQALGHPVTTIGAYHSEIERA